MYKLIHKMALDSTVLIAAVSDGRDWTAYIKGVPGNNHEEEIKLVMEGGNKLDKNLAEFLFPDIGKRYKWRE